jgi:lipoate-protein ligase A
VRHESDKAYGVRLIRTPPSPPAWNLALDEALLRSGTPTLRLYAWDPPGFSLGFFQRFAELEAPPGYEVVRRPTGGGAIAHIGELTIAWIGQRRRVDDVYADINAIVTAALARSFGIAAFFGTAQPEAAPAGLCFDAHTCYDLIVDGRKIFGSAQRRGGDRFLMHGSLLLERNPACAGAGSLSEVLGRAVSHEEAAAAVIEAAGRHWSVGFTQAEPTAAEIAATERLVSDRYANDAWTRRR